MAIQQSVSEVELILAKLLSRKGIKSPRNGQKSGSLKSTHRVNGVITVHIAGNVEAHATK